jgi:hypothetical protein
MPVYPIRSEFCAELAAGWRKTPRVHPEWAMQALLRRRTRTLSHLAREWPATPASR